MELQEWKWLRLHMTPGLGRVGIIRLIKTFKTLDAVLEAEADDWSKFAGIRKSIASGLPSADDRTFNRLVEDLDKLNVHIVSLWDDSYPDLLRAIYDPPVLLYVRGALPGQDALAVVGSRMGTEAGLRVTREICAELASRGIVIVSGLARGIDSAAHEGALDAEGVTVGVLGCGIDRIYPPENGRLFRRILERGGVVSEYPPGAPPSPGHFPGRNRIISGLSRGVLIVEAAEESGSLITADFALEQGRELFAVPGSVFSGSSVGTNRLLKEGAHLVTGPADILHALWPHVPSRASRREGDDIASTLDGNERIIYELLCEEPVHIDDLVRKTRLTPMEVSAILLHLEIMGGVEQRPGMRYLRRGGPFTNRPISRQETP